MKSNKPIFPKIYFPNPFLILFDFVSVILAQFLALLVRFEFSVTRIPSMYFEGFLKLCVFSALIVIVAFYLTGNYRLVLKMASSYEFKRTLISILISIILVTILYIILVNTMPRSFYFLSSLIFMLLTLMSRFGVRVLNQDLSRRTKLETQHKLHRTMIIGAGRAARMFIEDVNSDVKSKYNIVCAIDDDKKLHGKTISGIPVVGSRDDIMLAVEEYDIDTILYAIASASNEDKREILSICKETNSKLKTIPGLYQLVNGEVSISKVQDVQIEDLLGRETIQVLSQEDFNYIHNKVVLVTGGGGSIGSELCRQIAAHNPKQLLIFDIYENNAYDIQQELLSNYADLELVCLIGSVRDEKRIQEIFKNYQPEIVYHAAAHKHVPLMETSPKEAVKNNVFGTLNVAFSALMYNTERFILISTDKAVNPTNIMGTTKRLCEMIVQSMDNISKNRNIELFNLVKTNYFSNIDSTELECNFKTEFVSVRFGNVLGSNGSVIPLFKKQIQKGGPVSVTHPDIIRYFMTISEAVSLVLQAGNMAKGGEIFVLDMGSPVKIDSLARNLIKLSGFEPDVDIKVEYTGLRPGEKLYEEKLMAEEGLKKTENELIHIGTPIELDYDLFFNKLHQLYDSRYSENVVMIEILSDLVPTYHTPELDIKNRKDVFEKLYEDSK